MERLTVRDEYGNADIIGVLSSDIQLNLNYKDFNRVTDALNKLADYEDAEEQGLSLKVHCNVGSTVWVINKHDKQIKSGKVFRIVYENDIFMYYSTVYGFTGDDVGKTVFLTEEGAKQALKQIGE